MKIAIIRREVSYTKGGAERYAASLCRELCNMGHEVWVLAEKLGENVHPAINYLHIPVKRISSSQRSQSFHLNAQAALAKVQPDTKIALSRTYPSDVFRVSDPLHCYWMGVRYPGKIRRFIENLNPRHRAIFKIERAIMDPVNTRIIVTNSKLSKALIAKYYRYPQERVHVIYNGVDHEQFTPDPGYIEGDLIKLLFVGQDFKRKGLGPVIRAFAKVIDKGYDCTLRVIGSNKPGPYQKLATKLGISQRINFEGSTKEIQKTYQSSDLFIFPSLYDPFANVVLESLACSLPVLTTTTNGSSELIDEGQNGYVIEGATDHLVEDIAEKIIRFLQLPAEKRREMRSAAQKTARKYTISRNAEMMLEQLNQ